MSTDDRLERNVTPRETMLRFYLRHAKKIVVLVIGSTIVLLGVAMLPLPGPGMLVVLAGLAVLAAEFVWARQLLRRAKGAAKQAQAFYNSREKKRHLSRWIAQVRLRFSAFYQRAFKKEKYVEVPPEKQL